MIIECPSCRSKYKYDEERFERRPSKKIKCARCQSVFEVQNPAFASPEPALVDAGDSTYASRHRDVHRQEADAAAQAAEAAQQAAKSEPSLHLPAGKRLSLAILDGPDAGSVFRIEKPRISIGRSNADLTLNDSEASRQHAAIEVRGTNYSLIDLGSTNGTLVEGRKVDGTVDLTDKSEFLVGSTTLMLIVTDDH